MTTGGVVVLVVLVLELAVAVVLLRQARSLCEQVAAARAETPAPAVGPPFHPLIEVEIRGAQELAARESWAARRFGTLVPRLVRRGAVSAVNR
jgi:hypothetical protein